MGQMRLFAMTTVMLTCWAAMAERPAAGGEFNPFASRVIDVSLNPGYPSYLPAPGGFINNSQFNDAGRALGAPNGAGTAVQSNSSVVSLGGLGGQIVLAFEQDVWNSPANPMGLDAIVFTNTFWPMGDPQLHHAELATIEIMPDLDGSGIPGSHPDEKWYLIPGSLLSGPLQPTVRTWERHGNTQPPGYYPGYADWPDTYQTAAYKLDVQFQTVGGLDGVVINPNALDGDPSTDHLEAIWGYAEWTPTLRLGDRNVNNRLDTHGDMPDMDPRIFYTTPSDPFTVGITPGSGGGDAFDISWAIDPDTGLPANLQSFRFIRITTAVDYFSSSMGEASAELMAVAAVRATSDVNGDGRTDMADYHAFFAAYGSQWGDAAFDPAADITVSHSVGTEDLTAFRTAWEKVVLPGDLNLDGKVDLQDLALLAHYWGTSHGAVWAMGDLTWDGSVGEADLEIFRQAWVGAGWNEAALMQAVAIPEPATLGLLMTGAAALLWRRRKAA